MVKSDRSTWSVSCMEAGCVSESPLSKVPLYKGRSTLMAIAITVCVPTG